MGKETSIGYKLFEMYSNNVVDLRSNRKRVTLDVV